MSRELIEDGYNDDPKQFMEALPTKWLDRMEKDEKRKEIASLLKDWYLKYYPDKWQKPRNKNKEKVERIKRVLHTFKLVDLVEK